MSSDLLIKIQCKEKIYKIFKPQSFIQLRNEFINRFKLKENSIEIIYLDAQNVEITVESEDDYAVAEVETPPIRKFLVKGGEESAQSPAVISQDVLNMFTSQLEGHSSNKQFEDLQTIIEQNELPCYFCYDFDAKTSDEEGLELFQSKEGCAHCGGTGVMGQNSSWQLVMKLVEQRFKKYLLDPLKQFQGSFKLPENVQNDAKSEVKSVVKDVNSPPKPSTFPRFMQLFSPEDKNSVRPATETSFTRNDTSFITQSSPMRSDRLGVVLRKFETRTASRSPTKMLPSKFYAVKDLNIAAEEDEFEEKPLHFHLSAFDAVLIKKNTVEVKMFVENKLKEDWPNGVKIIGKPDCKLTKDVVHPLEKRLKAASRIGVRFTFECNERDIEKDAKNVLEFQFQAVDNVQKVKYTSNFSIPLDDKKKMKFSFCKLLS